MKTLLACVMVPFVLAACGGSDGVANSDGRIALSDARPGTCVVLGDDTYINRSLEVPCAGGSEAKVAGFTQLEGDASAEYPGWHATDSAGYDKCQPVFEKFTGTDFWSSALDITAVTPSASTWRRGDRLVACLIVPPA